jgi:hypothetical protein
MVFRRGEAFGAGYELSSALNLGPSAAVSVVALSEMAELAVLRASHLLLCLLILCI